MQPETRKQAGENSNGEALNGADACLAGRARRSARDFQCRRGRLPHSHAHVIGDRLDPESVCPDARTTSVLTRPTVAPTSTRAAWEARAMLSEPVGEHSRCAVDPPLRLCRLEI